MPISSNTDKVFDKQLKKLSRKLDKLDFETYFRKMPKLVRQRTLDGLGVNKSGEEYDLPGFKNKSYIERRKKLKSDGEMSSKTSPAKSNLTLTGQLLSAIIAQRVDKLSQRLALLDDRNDGKSNYDIEEGQRKKRGRRFLALSKKEISFLDKLIVEGLNKIIKRIFEKG
jgi:hypothetical protein